MSTSSRIAAARATPKLERYMALTVLILALDAPACRAAPVTCESHAIRKLNVASVGRFTVLWYAAGIWRRLERQHRTRGESADRGEHRDAARQPRGGSHERCPRRLKFPVRELTPIAQELHSKRERMAAPAMMPSTTSSIHGCQRSTRGTG